MPVKLPWWIRLGYFEVKFWFVTAPIAITLVAAWYAAHGLGGWRFAIYGVAALLLLPFPVTAAIVLYRQYDATRYDRTLAGDAAIEGLPLPAGSTLHFADKAHAHLVSIDLPRAAEIRGLRLSGRLLRWRSWEDLGPIWGVALAEDQQATCRAAPATSSTGSVPC